MLHIVLTGHSQEVTCKSDIMVLTSRHTFTCKLCSLLLAQHADTHYCICSVSSMHVALVSALYTSGGHLLGFSGI